MSESAQESLFLDVIGVVSLAGFGAEVWRALDVCRACRADARARVIELIDRAHIRQARRVATKPSKAAKARRVDAKKGRSTVKKNRGKVSFD
jgi:hypothetical protein